MMKIFKKIDNIIVLVFVVMTAIYAYMAVKMPYYGRGIIGAAFFPKILAGVMFFLCAAFFVVSISKPDKSKSVGDEGFDLKVMFKPVAAIVLIMAYSFGLFNFGFKIPTFIFFLLMMRLYGEKRWTYLILVPLITTALFDVIFRVIFKLPIRELSIF